MNWLDTETKAILQKEDESKPTLVKTAEFALVLIRKGTDDERLVRAIRRINECGEAKAVELVHLPKPVTINAGLTEAEAYFGQFELICCDAIAAFFRSEIILEQNEPRYLRALYQQIERSREFKPTLMEVVQVPATEGGEMFIDQFIGNDFSNESFSCVVPYKKARIMKHWATRVGAEVRYDVVDQVAEDEEDF